MHTTLAKLRDLDKAVSFYFFFVFFLFLNLDFLNKFSCLTISGPRSQSSIGVVVVANGYSSNTYFLVLILCVVAVH